MTLLQHAATNSTLSGTNTYIGYGTVVSGGGGSSTSSITPLNIITHPVTDNTTINTASLMLAAREAAFFALKDEDVQQYIGVSRTFDYNCPDGTVLRFEGGNVTILDQNAKVIYKSNPIREFNKYLNASDLLEDFIEFCKTQNVKQSEFMDLPIQSFIMWLVVKSAEQDGEDPGEVPLMLEDSRKKRITKPKCKCCGKYLPKIKASVSQFCNGSHMDRYMEKIAA